MCGWPTWSGARDPRARRAGEGACHPDDRKPLYAIRRDACCAQMNPSVAPMHRQPRRAASNDMLAVEGQHEGLISRAAAKRRARQPRSPITRPATPPTTAPRIAPRAIAGPSTMLRSDEGLLCTSIAVTPAPMAAPVSAPTKVLHRVPQRLPSGPAACGTNGAESAAAECSGLARCTPTRASTRRWAFAGAGANSDKAEIRPKVSATFLMGRIP